MGQYLDWKVGDRVVCIDDAGRPWESDGFVYVRKGSVYTIREMYMTHRLAILVDEIVNKPVRVKGHGVREPGFGAYGFCKVEPRKTSIAVFERILHGKSQKVDA